MKDAMLWDRGAPQDKQNAAVIIWLTSLFYSTMVHDNIEVKVPVNI